MFDRARVPIVRAGILAQEFCADTALAEVAAVYERSLYLRAGDRFVCIGAPVVGHGPSTLTADSGEGARLSELGLRAGAPAFITDQEIAVGTIHFMLDGCALWRPPDWPALPSPVHLAATCAALARRIALEAPNFGDSLPITPIARSPRVAKLGECVSCHRNSSSAVEAVEGLVGFGPGLTPSGDDVLIGALAMLDALQEREVHAALARAINALAPGMTSPLSLCFLRAAAAGHVSERFHTIVSSVIAGDVGRAIATAQAIGHSSGWDMLTGAVVAAQSCRSEE